MPYLETYCGAVLNFQIFKSTIPHFHIFACFRANPINHSSHKSFHPICKIVQFDPLTFYKSPTGQLMTTHFINSHKVHTTTVHQYSPADRNALQLYCPVFEKAILTESRLAVAVCDAICKTLFRFGKTRVPSSSSQ